MPTSFLNLSLLNRVCRIIDTMNEWIGRAVAWLVLAMALIIVYDVSMRYLFRIGSVALQELEWHLFSLLFLLGAAYTLKHDAHVRVDIFYQSRWMDDRRRALIDLLGVLFLLIPFCIMVVVSSGPFIGNSFSMGEGSPDAGGLPYRFLLKAAIPTGFALLVLQGVSQMIHALLILSGHNPPNSSQTDSSAPDTAVYSTPESTADKKE